MYLQFEFIHWYHRHIIHTYICRTVHKTRDDIYLEKGINNLKNLIDECKYSLVNDEKHRFQFFHKH